MLSGSIPRALASALLFPSKYLMASAVSMPHLIDRPIDLSIGNAIRRVSTYNSADNLGVPRQQKPLRVIPERITEARDAHGWTTSEFARQAKLSQPTVWALENGITKEAKLSTIQKLAIASGRHIAFFTGEVDQNTEPIVLSQQVPVISWVQAGSTNPAVDPYQPGTAEDWEPVMKPVSDSAYALRVRGDSMVAPDGTGFADGSIIIVDPNEELRNGDCVVVRFQNTDEATFKKYVVDGPLRFLKPLNPTYPTIPLSDDAMFCGVVVEHHMARRFR